LSMTTVSIGTEDAAADAEPGTFFGVGSTVFALCFGSRPLSRQK
jgi:hypothetical protein